MPHYKDNQNNLHYLSDSVDPSTIHGFPQDAVVISDEEAEALRSESLPNPKIGKILGIKAKRTQVQAGGVQVAAKWFHSDGPSRIQQLGLVIMGANIPPGIQWKTMDGSFVEMTQTLAGQIFSAVAALDMAAFAISESHFYDLDSSVSPSDYDYSTGWPAVYMPE